MLVTVEINNYTNRLAGGIPRSRLPPDISVGSIVGALGIALIRPMFDTLNYG